MKCSIHGMILQGCGKASCCLQMLGFTVTTTRHHDFLCQPNLLWLVVSTPLKNMSHLGWSFPIYIYIYIGKIQVMFQSPPISPSCHVQTSNSLQVSSWSTCLGSIFGAERAEDNHPWRRQCMINLHHVNITSMFRYPLVNKHSYRKWPCVVDFPIENGDFPWFC